MAKITSYDDGMDRGADEIIWRCLEDNSALDEVPFLGPLLIHAGIDRANRSEYLAMMQKEELDSADSLAAPNSETKLREAGLPMADVHRLMVTFKTLHVISEVPLEDAF